MVLSEIRCLPLNEKCLWLQSPEGLTQLEEWLKAGITVKMVAETIGIKKRTLYVWSSKYPEMKEIVRKYAMTRQIIKPDYSRPATYRLLVGRDSGYNHQGEIAAEYSTAEEVWQSDFIRRYYASYRCSAEDYYDAYTQQLKNDGIYKLSNLYTFAYCEVTKQGRIKILRPAP